MYERPSTYKAPSTPNQTLNQLKQGKIPIDQTLHLRGMTQDEAAKHLTQILTTPQKQTLYLLIHGKGLRSENTPVLKSLVCSILYHHPNVLAYCQATPKDGGSGALYALISNR